MASPIRVQLDFDTPQPERRDATVRAVFNEVERQCTRFDANSDLMQANAAAGNWHQVGAYCFEALAAASTAHDMTDGVFDPRVLRTLTDLGYALTLDLADGDVAVDRPLPAPRPARGRWVLDLDEKRMTVRVGPEPIDLGGIGKGLALRWAAAELVAGGCPGFLLDAGGDCVAGGAGPDGGGWRIGVEDPNDGADPVAVLELVDVACATSSTRLLNWRVGNSRVHHLIDPRTGRPGGGDLASVTVVADDAAEAEIWSKVLFLHGDEIAEVADRHELAALWVREDGSPGCTAAMRPHVVWERP
ncbi:MAG: FAD:protein FMN transferase [Jatrophihabitantaceae bacterium]